MEERQVMPGGRPESARKAGIISAITLCFVGTPARPQPPSQVDVFRKVDPIIIEIHTPETFRLPGSQDSSRPWV